MITIKQNDIITICGKRGSGKTYLMKNILKAVSNFFVYDPLHQISISDAYITKNFNDAINVLRKGSKRIIYNPIQINITEFDTLCRMIYSVGNIMFLVDEADRIMPSRAITKNASALIDLGRTSLIGGIFVTRRLARLDSLPISQSDHVMAFKTILPQDVKYLKEFIGEIAEQAPNLKPYHFLYYDGNETIIHKPI